MRLRAAAIWLCECDQVKETHAMRLYITNISGITQKYHFKL